MVDRDFGSRILQEQSGLQQQYVGEETRVILASARPAVRDVLALTHLDEVFPVVDRPHEAWEDTTAHP